MMLSWMLQKAYLGPGWKKWVDLMRNEQRRERSIRELSCELAGRKRKLDCQRAVSTWFQFATSCKLRRIASNKVFAMRRKSALSGALEAFHQFAKCKIRSRSLRETASNWARYSRERRALEALQDHRTKRKRMREMRLRSQNFHSRSILRRYFNGIAAFSKATKEFRGVRQRACLVAACETARNCLATLR